MTTQDSNSYRTAPIWSFLSIALISLPIIAWYLGVRGIEIVAAFIFFVWLFGIYWVFRVSIDHEGFTVSCFPAAFFGYPVRVRWSDIVELQDWEFIAFEETWGIKVQAKKNNGKIRRTIIPGFLSNMSEILSTFLAYAPSTAIVDPHLRWRAQQLARRKPALLMWFPRLGILTLVAACLGAGITGFSLLRNPAAQWGSLIVNTNALNIVTL